MATIVVISVGSSRNLREDDRLQEAARKFEARCLLLDTQSPIIVPTQEELIGGYLLERDDELKRN